MKKKNDYSISVLLKVINYKIKIKYILLIITVGILLININPLIKLSKSKISSYYYQLFPRYENLSISKSIYEELEKRNISIRKPYNIPSIKGKESNIHVGSPDFSKHRFSDYYYLLSDYINSKKTILYGKKIRDSYLNTIIPSLDSTSKKDAIDRLKLIVGYHDKIKPTGSIMNIQKVKNKFGHNLEKIKFSGRFGVPFILFRGIPICDPKGIVIAIHGRSSAPDYVMGMYENDDYSRSFGAYWLEKGFIVYAPQVDWSSGLPMERLGYSYQGADLAKLVDIISYIKKSTTNNGVSPIISMGISYGSMLSEWLGAISNDIDAVISIGGSARGDPFIGCMDNSKTINPEKIYYNSYLPPDYFLYYAGIGIYRLIAPKPLVISIGSHDHDECKFQMILNTIDYYTSIGFKNRIAVNVFMGFHEADPEGEFIAFNLLENIHEH